MYLQRMKESIVNMFRLLRRLLFEMKEMKASHFATSPRNQRVDVVFAVVFNKLWFNDR